MFSAHNGASIDFTTARLPPARTRGHLSASLRTALRSAPVSPQAGQ